jgi:hypothetical protein
MDRHDKADSRLAVLRKRLKMGLFSEHKGNPARTKLIHNIKTSSLSQQIRRGLLTIRIFHYTRNVPVQLTLMNTSQITRLKTVDSSLFHLTELQVLYL